MLSLDLRRVRSESDVIRAVLSLLGSTTTVASSWQQVGKALRACRTSNVIRLVGLNHLEQVAPTAAQQLFRVFGRHNSGASAVIQEVIVGDDYEAVVYCTTLEVRRFASGREEAGAFVTCWIKCAASEEATEGARSTVEAAGWHVHTVGECDAVQRSDYVDNPDALTLLEQCYVDGEVCTFHTWTVARDS
jgi:hypothetical protein